MKNVINYFYNLQPDSIYQQGQQSKFSINNNNYVLLPYTRSNEELKDLQLLSTSLLAQGIICHQFIPNINSSLVTLVNDKPYVLLIVYINNNNYVSFNDLVWVSNIQSLPEVKSLRRDDWFILWTKKIDYLEYQVSQFGKTYPLLRESFSYFVGMAETGISLLKSINTNYEPSLSLSYRRIKKDDSLFELYNPLNFIIDYRLRNIVEYFKDCFFKDLNLTASLFNYLSYNNLESDEAILFYARMLFPTFYFDIYEKIVHKEVKEEEILRIVHKMEEYESFLSYLYNYFKSNMPFPEIEWISNK